MQLSASTQCCAPGSWSQCRRQSNRTSSRHSRYHCHSRQQQCRSVPDRLEPTGGAPPARQGQADGAAMLGNSTAILALLACTVSLGLACGAADAAQEHVATHHSVPLFNLAEGEEDFASNLARYGRFFITVLLGTAYTAGKPIVALLKRPRTAVLVIAGGTGLYFFVSSTVRAMLGVTDPTSIQMPSNFLPEGY